MIEPAKIDITIYQGATYRQGWKLSKESDGSPFNLNGWTARMQVRTKLKDENPVLDLTTENGGISIITSAEVCQYEIYITPIQTAGLIKGGVYDIELIDSAGEVVRIQQGKVNLDLEVTR